MSTSTESRFGKNSFDSHLFYPDCLANCKERSFIIGYNIVAFNCTVCCVVRKSLVEDNYDLIEKGLKELNDNPKYHSTIGSKLSLLGEFIPSSGVTNMTTDEVTHSIPLPSYQARDIWMTLTCDKSTQKLSLLNVYSCN